MLMLVEVNGTSDMWLNLERWPDVSPYVSLSVCVRYVRKNTYIHTT